MTENISAVFYVANSDAAEGIFHFSPTFCLCHDFRQDCKDYCGL